jgi:hypothetical protein
MENPDPGSGMVIPDHNLVLVFWLKILKFFGVDPDPGSCQPWIRDRKIGSGILDLG